MSALLTKDEFQRIADSLTPATNAFINGKFAPAKSGATFTSENPGTGKALAEVAACDQADVDYAVGKAREAFESGVWSRLHPSERKETMIRLVKLMKRHRHELAVLESIDSGKPIRECATLDVPETMHCLAWHAEAADKLYDQVSPSGDDALGLIVREPLGVVATVLPWNFPLMMVAWKLGPALASGNSVIIKPAEQTSLSTLKLCELAIEAGIPPGVLNVLPGLGETVGQAIGLHPGIDMVSFTGSTEVGRKFLEYSARSNLKRIVLECGGKNPCIVMDDAENLDHVAEQAVYAVFWNMGQNCTSNSRLIVHEAVKDRLLEKVIQKTRDWRTGDPMDPANRLGALVSEEHFSKVMGHIEAGRKEGASVVVGGEPLDLGGGYYVPPTIFDGVSPDMSIARDEIFGPVLTVLTCASEQQAVEMANDTEYGLQASLFTGGVRRAHRMSRAIRAGTVTVNCYGEGDITTPFGGYKQSGFGGRDNSLQAHDQYTETKTIWIDLGDDRVDSELD